jgi:hypothetical protein
MISWACAALSDLYFSSDDSSSSEKNEKVKRKPGDFIALCLMGKSSWHISDSDSDISDDLSIESLFLRVVEIENALCNQDKLLYKVFRKNKKLNLELESAFFEIASLRSTHDDMSVKPCDNYTMIIINYADLCLLHSRLASLLNYVKLELRESKLILHCLVLAPLVLCLDLIWRLRPLRLKILNINLIILLATVWNEIWALLDREASWLWWPFLDNSWDLSLLNSFSVSRVVKSADSSKAVIFILQTWSSKA